MLADPLCWHPAQGRRMRFSQLNRRGLITLLGGAAAWPVAARARKPGRVYRIGFLANDPTIPSQPAYPAFLDELRDGGFIDGKNAVEGRFAEAKVDRYADLAAELVRREVDVLVTSTNLATLAAKRICSEAS